MLYFSYGSNMSSKRLKERVPSASFVSIATLTRHELRFHKKGADGSSKCDANETGRDEHIIMGVIFDISHSEKPELDKKEGLTRGYEEKIVNLQLQSGEFVKATTYYATNIDTSKKPYHWYKQHVLEGAEEYSLPRDYIERIKDIESIPDPEPGRHEREMAIYSNK